MYKNRYKRCLDIFVTIILFFPYLIIHSIIAVLIKSDSKGKIIFKQARVGKNKKIFYIYKFRTMVEDAENLGSGIYTSKSDPRITRMGRVLRKTSLDELPQIINILKGDMSYVGPRPPVPYHPYKVSEYSNKQNKRFEVRPGITGLAQIEGRNKLTWDERIESDLEYVDNISLFLDFKIIVKTLLNIFLSKDVYSKK